MLSGSNKAMQRSLKQGTPVGSPLRKETDGPSALPAESSLLAAGPQKERSARHKDQHLPPLPAAAFAAWP